MFKSIWLWIVGSLVGMLFMVRSLFFRTVRISREMSMGLYELVQTKGRSFILYEEIVEQRLPRIYDAVCWLGSWFPFRLRIEERMLRAGYASTDSVTTVTALRWKLNSILTQIITRKKDNAVKVYLLQPWDADQIGSMSTEENPEPYIDPELYRPLEKEVAEVVEGKRKRTSAIMCGPPGNGKSFLGRYLALKYKMPIYIVTFRPDQDNHDVIRMFSRLKGPAIVIMEDFDGYFKGRECQLENAKFTFDAILNVLDGTYATMEGLVVLMTINNLKDVDPALQNRPGRFRHVFEVGNPEQHVVQRVFEGYGPIPATAVGCSLDELLALRDSMTSRGCKVEDVNISAAKLAARKD